MLAAPEETPLTCVALSKVEHAGGIGGEAAY